jgi:hypothetical protein
MTAVYYQNGWPPERTQIRITNPPQPPPVSLLVWFAQQLELKRGINPGISGGFSWRERNISALMLPE